MSILEKVNNKIKICEELIAHADQREKEIKEKERKYYWYGVKNAIKTELGDLKEIQADLEMASQSIEVDLSALRGE